MTNQILKEPIITEKSMKQTEGGSYVFKVEKGVTKNQIKEAINSAFGVDVVEVMTINVKGKKRKSGQHSIEISGYKKAIIRLASGQKIEAFEEPKSKKISVVSRSRSEQKKKEEKTK